MEQFYENGAYVVIQGMTTSFREHKFLCDSGFNIHAQVVHNLCAAHLSFYTFWFLMNKFSFAKVKIVSMFSCFSRNNSFFWQNISQFADFMYGK